MAVFELDATNAISGVTKLSSKVKQVGIELDALELSKSLATGVRSIDKVFEGLHTSVKLSKSELDRLGTSFNTLRFTGEAAVTGIVAAQQKAYITLKAYTDQNNTLNKVLRDTDSKNIQISTTRTLNTLQEKAAADLAVVTERTRLLSTEEGRSLAIAKELAKAKTLMATQGDRLKITLSKQTEQQRLLNDADAKAVANNRVIIAALERSATAAARLAAEEIKLRTERELGNSATAKRIAALRAEEAAIASAKAVKAEEVQYYQRKTMEVAKLRRELAYLTTAEAKQAALLRQQVAEQNRALVASTAVQVNKTKQLRIAAQATAALRASLAGMQASIGMYTSSTILAASATYAFARALRSGLEVGIEFTAAMARTEAIMSSSAGGALFASLESQVRLLGQTTQFTVTQVAEAATELGQAGLSAGQSIIALQPALDLAIIGNLSMASSADHATNIMMIFGKEATQLSSIVDTLAMAVTNSNTNIDQMANALTYAGPAAHALGISMEDTVAAVESLANSGFKASRAGTALRRLFVSLANPTKKGQEVLDKYNVSVTDLYGNAKSLTDILQQLQTAFQDLSGAEKLTAIQNLVGVYATSPVAGLLENVDNFVALRVQLELAAGAADKMKAKIEDALKFDLREVKSAFEELQLSVFKNNEQQLRVWAQEVTAFIRHLSDAADGGATNLERYAETIKNYGVALGYIYAAAKIVPLLQRFGASASAASAATLSATGNTVKLTKSVMALAMQMNVSSSAIVRNTGALTANAAAGVLAARQAVASGTALLMRGAAAVSGVGTAALVAYAAWQAVTSIFGKSDLPNSLEEQEARVSGLKGAYSELTKEAKAYQLVRTQKILGEQQDSLTVEIEETKLRLDAETQILEVLKREGQSYSFMESKIILTKRELEDKQKTLQVISESLDEQKTLQDQHVELTQKILDLSAQEAFVMGNKTAFYRELNKLSAERLKIEKQMVDVQRKNTIAGAISAGNAMAFGGYNETLNTVAAKASPVSDQMAAVSGEMSQLLAVRSELLQILEAADAGDPHAKAQADLAVERWEKNSQALAKVGATFAGLVADYGKANLELGQIWKEADFAGLSDVEKKIELNKELASLTTFLGTSRKQYDLGGIVDHDKVKQAAERVKEIKSSLVGLNKEAARPVKNMALEQAIALSDSLRMRYDAVGHSARKRKDAEEQLLMLVQRGDLASSDYSKALGILAEDHYKVEQAANVHAIIAKRLSDTYLKSGMDQQIQDLVDLDKAYQGVARSSEAYRLKQEAIFKAAKSGEGPKVQPTGATGLFSEFIDASITQTTDLSTYEKDRLEYELAYKGQAEHHALMMAAEMEAANKTIENEQAKNDKLHAITLDYQAKQKAAASLYRTGERAMADEQAHYVEQSQKLVLASMAGSLSQMVGMIADAAEEGSSTQKIAFAASKALAIAQILLQTHVAAANARALPGGAGEGLAAWIMAQGYASAGFAAALAIGEMSGSGKSSSGGSSYAGAYDKGGYIPTGKYGIVGEYGPEIVNGPANVTGREATARKMNSGQDSGPQNVTIENNINIEYTSEGEGGTNQDAQVLGNAIKLVVLDTMRDQLRPNGMLHKRT